MNDFDISFDLGDLLLREEPMHFKKYVKNPSALITWKDIEFCMNHPALYDLELISPEGRKMPHSKFDLAREKRFLFDAFQDGHSLVITNYGMYNPRVNQLCQSLEQKFDINAQIHVYCGRGRSARSFPIHCDTPTNFIIQIEGRTPWKVYRNRMSNLLSFESHQIQNPKEEDFEVVLDVVLEPGDGLLIPPRQYHWAAPNDSRISLSIPCFPRINNEKPFDRNFYKLTN